MSWNRDLNKVYRVSHNEYWMPACSTGFDIGVIATIGLGFSAFIRNVVLLGIEWDMTKALLSWLWKCLTKFAKENNDVELQNMVLKFNDVTINVNGVMADQYGRLTKLFIEMNEHLQYLKSQGITDVSEIELPYIKDENADDGILYLLEFHNIEKCWWEVIYLKGCEHCYFNPETCEVA